MNQRGNKEKIRRNLSSKRRSKRTKSTTIAPLKTKKVKKRRATSLPEHLEKVLTLIPKQERSMQA